MIQNSVIPVLMVIGILGAIHLFFYLMGNSKNNNRSIDATSSKDLLSGPGQSFRREIKQIDGKAKRCLILLLTLPFIVMAAHVVYSKIGKVPETWLRTAVVLSSSFLILGYYLTKWLRLRTNRSYLQFGYEGEVTVAHELMKLKSMGYRIYHGFPCDGFNIDHLLIGPGGVMVIKTKTFSKGGYKIGKNDSMVTYDGRMLHFPRFSDHRVIDNAKQHGEWLSHWLLTHVGEEISARAILALPGLHVKRSSPDGIPVVNPSQLVTLFKHIKPRPLTDAQIERIVRQIEHQCSEVDFESNSCYSLSL